MNAQINPGCYGAATVFAFDSEVCKQCTAYSPCGKEAMGTLERIKTIVKVDDLIARHRKAREKALKAQADADAQALKAAPPGPMATPTPTKPVARSTPAEKVEYEVSEKHSRIIATMPVKAQTFALKLCKSGFIKHMRQDLFHKNITAGIPKWLALSLKLLQQEGFTRASLKAHLMQELNWSDGTAASHVSLAVALLVGFEIASEDSGNFTLSSTIEA